MALSIIDFSPFLSPSSTPAQKRSTALEIDQACREVGFFYLSNHGIDAALTQRMLDNARTFCDRASPEEKHGLAIKDAGDGIGDSARGFQRVEGGAKGVHEAVDVFRPVDNSGGPPYDVGFGENQWPQTPENFREVSEEYITAVLSLAMEVVRAIAMALEVDEKVLLSRVDKSFWNLRIIGYEAMEEKADISKVSGIGEHTDFGILTLLLTDPQKGSLQVRSKSGDWIAADPIPGCYLINLRDMLSKWTNGIYVSTKHRVIHSSTKWRVSIPFFFDPNMDAIISPVLPIDNGSNEDEGILFLEKFVNSIKYSIIT